MTNLEPFDITCYNNLYEKFQNIFEDELINEICQFGTLRTFDEDELIMDIGDEMKELPLIVSGSLKILTEDDEGRELLIYYLELGETCAVTLNCCSRATKSKIRAVTESKAEILFERSENQRTYDQLGREFTEPPKGFYIYKGKKYF